MPSSVRSAVWKERKHCIARHLRLVDLFDRRINSGAQEGNEYFVYLSPQVNSPGRRVQKLPGVPQVHPQRA